jgi:hypothetical protein
VLGAGLEALGNHALHAVGAYKVARVEYQRLTTTRPAGQYAKTAGSHHDSYGSSAHEQIGTGSLCTLREHGQDAGALDHEIGHLQPYFAFGATRDHTHYTGAMHNGFVWLKAEHAMQMWGHDPGSLGLIEHSLALEHEDSLAADGQQFGCAQPRAGSADHDDIVPAAAYAVRILA